jgi:hypothetical protein
VKVEIAEFELSHGVFLAVIEELFTPKAGVGAGMDFRHGARLSPFGVQPSKSSI